MEIWLDTCNVRSIEAASHLGLPYGITTNPSLLAAAPNDYKDVINELLEAQNGPVAVQVTADQASEMVEQALALHAFSDRIIVKIPVIKEGLIAMKSLSEEGVSIMGTAVFQLGQALLAALAGADYIAPYIGRMSDAGTNVDASLQMMLTVYRNYGFTTKILGAALRTTDQIVSCASMGMHGVTLKDALFFEFLADDLSAVACLKTFDEEWKARNFQKSIKLIF